MVKVNFCDDCAKKPISEPLCEECIRKLVSNSEIFTEALKGYITIGMPIPTEWVTEYNNIAGWWRRKWMYLR